MTMNQWRWTLLNIVLLSAFGKSPGLLDFYLMEFGLIGLSVILLYEIIWLPFKEWWGRGIE